MLFCLLNQMNIEVVAVTEKAERLIYELDPNNSLCFNFRCRRQRNFKLSYKTSRQKSQNSIIWKNIFFKCFSCLRLWQFTKLYDKE